MLSTIKWTAGLCVAAAAATIIAQQEYGEAARKKWRYLHFYKNLPQFINISGAPMLFVYEENTHLVPPMRVFDLNKQVVLDTNILKYQYAFRADKDYFISVNWARLYQEDPDEIGSFREHGCTFVAEGRGVRSTELTRQETSVCELVTGEALQAVVPVIEIGFDSVLMGLFRRLQSNPTIRATEKQDLIVDRPLNYQIMFRSELPSK